MINFNSIPVGVRVPGRYIEFDSSKAINGAVFANEVLLVGQMLDAGGAEPLEPRPIGDADQATYLFGRGSQLAQMAAAARTADNYSQMTAIGLADPATGTAAAGTITITGAPEANGTIRLMIAGQKVPVIVAKAATPTAMAAAMAAAINALPDLPVTASSDAGVVTVTARHKGSLGNDIDIRHSHYMAETLPAGVSLAIAAMSGGAGDPDYSEIWAAIGDGDYRTVIIGSCNDDILDALAEGLHDRNGAIRMLHTQIYAAASGSQGALAALGNGLNDPFMSILGAYKMPSPPWQLAASYGAVIGYHSHIDPARPFQTLSLPNIEPPKTEDLFTLNQRDALLHDGISTFVVDPAGIVHIERAITTYQLNAAGVADMAFLNVNSILTLAYLRASLAARIALKFPRHKLADNDGVFTSDQSMVTPAVIKGEIIALAGEDWQQKGLVEDMAQFKADLRVKRNSDDPDRLDALLPPNLVNQFRVFAAQIQFRW